jgi:hypothetical protein
MNAQKNFFILLELAPCVRMWKWLCVLNAFIFSFRECLID